MIKLMIPSKIIGGNQIMVKLNQITLKKKNTIYNLYLPIPNTGKIDIERPANSIGDLLFMLYSFLSAPFSSNTAADAALPKAYAKCRGLLPSIS